MRSPGPGLPHRMPPESRREIVGVQGLPKIHHHVVGDIDDGRDAVDAHAAQALAQPRRGSPRPGSRRESPASRKSGQPLADRAHRKDLAVRGRHGVRVRRQITPLLGRRVVARNAEHAHTIAAIRRRVHLQHHIVEIERLAQVRHSAEGRQLHDPVVFLPRPSSRAEHSMPFDSTPRSLAGLMRTSSGSWAPTMATATFSPARTFFAPQTISGG